MGQVKIVEDTGIEGLKVLRPTIHKDSRGYFVETYSKRDFADIGIDCTFVQDNESCSTKGVIRGLHFQNGVHSQAKLVRVTYGAVYDVAVDLRKDSPTYGKAYGVLLSEDNHNQFFIPENFAHGFIVLSDVAIFSYKVNKFYEPGDEGGILWSDPSLNIDWPIESVGGFEKLILSEKDTKWPTLAEYTKNHTI